MASISCKNIKKTTIKRKRRVDGYRCACYNKNEKWEKCIFLAGCIALNVGAPHKEATTLRHDFKGGCYEI